MDIISATLLSFLVGISGTLAGGITILYRFDHDLKRQTWFLGFAGGIMIAVVLFDLWPEAWLFGGPVPALIGTGLGFLLVQGFDLVLKMLPWYRKHGFSRLTRAGILLGLGIGIHNFPEGVALGTTYIASREFREWLGLALIMSLHNIPEGMVMASAFKIGKVRFLKILIALILVELPMAFGGTAGAWLGRISPWMVSLSLGFAGGAMFILVFKELLPAARKLAGLFWVGTGFMVGFLVGVVLVGMI